MFGLIPYVVLDVNWIIALIMCAYVFTENCIYKSYIYIEFSSLI